MKTAMLTLIVTVTSIFPLIASQGDSIIVRVTPTLDPSSSPFVRYVFPAVTVSKNEIVPNETFGCTEYRIDRLVINRFQYWFDNYKSGQRDAKQFMSDIERDAIDTTLLSPNKIKSYVHVFCGLKKAKKVVVVDADNDGDFTNDTVFEFDTLTTEKQYLGDAIGLAPLVKVRYESFSKGKVVSKYAFRRIKPFDIAYNYRNDLDRRLTVYSVPIGSRTGEFRIGENLFKVAMMFSPEGHQEDYRKPYLRIQKAEKVYDIQEAPAQMGEIVVADSHAFKIVSCNWEGTELKLLYEGYQENRVGGMENNLVPTLEGKSLNHTLINIQTLLLGKRYVLLDFWGSWCGPCIRSMPALKTLHTQVDTTKIQFIGIDYEYNTAGQASAQVQLSRFKINWPQVAELSTAQAPSSFPVILSIKNYPTFLLISPEGKVVAREIGEDGLPKIVETLRKVDLMKKQ
ncbi:MAG: TlpA disulfide reductase family protein [Runella sp.]